LNALKKNYSKITKEARN